jgi:hypothetical protein
MARRRWRRWLASVLPEVGGVVIYFALLGAFWLIGVLMNHVLHTTGDGPWAWTGMLVGRFGGWGLLAIPLMLAVVAGGLCFAFFRLMGWGIRRLTPGDC